MKKLKEGDIVRVLAREGTPPLFHNKFGRVQAVINLKAKDMQMLRILTEHGEVILFDHKVGLVEEGGENEA